MAQDKFPQYERIGTHIFMFSPRLLLFFMDGLPSMIGLRVCCWFRALARAGTEDATAVGCIVLLRLVTSGDRSELLDRCATRSISSAGRKNTRKRMFTNTWQVQMTLHVTCHLFVDWFSVRPHLRWRNDVQRTSCHTCKPKSSVYGCNGRWMHTGLCASVVVTRKMGMILLT